MQTNNVSNIEASESKLNQHRKQEATFINDSQFQNNVQENVISALYDNGQPQLHTNSNKNFQEVNNATPITKGEYFYVYNTRIKNSIKRSKNNKVTDTNSGSEPSLQNQNGSNYYYNLKNNVFKKNDIDVSGIDSEITKNAFSFNVSKIGKYTDDYKKIKNELGNISVGGKDQSFDCNRFNYYNNSNVNNINRNLNNSCSESNNLILNNITGNDKLKSKVEVDSRRLNQPEDKNILINHSYYNDLGVNSNNNKQCLNNQDRSNSSPIKMPKLKITQSCQFSKNSNSNINQLPSNQALNVKNTPDVSINKQIKKLTKIKETMRKNDKSAVKITNTTGDNMKDIFNISSNKGYVNSNVGYFSEHENRAPNSQYNLLNGEYNINNRKKNILDLAIQDRHQLVKNTTYSNLNSGLESAVNMQHVDFLALKRERNNDYYDHEELNRKISPRKLLEETLQSIKEERQITDHMNSTQKHTESKSLKHQVSITPLNDLSMIRETNQKKLNDKFIVSERSASKLESIGINERKGSLGNINRFNIPQTTKVGGKAVMLKKQNSDVYYEHSFVNSRLKANDIISVKGFSCRNNSNLENLVSNNKLEINHSLGRNKSNRNFSLNSKGSNPNITRNNSKVDNPAGFQEIFQRRVQNSSKLKNQFSSHRNTDSQSYKIQTNDSTKNVQKVYVVNKGKLITRQDSLGSNDCSKLDMIPKGFQIYEQNINTTEHANMNNLKSINPKIASKSFDETNVGGSILDENNKLKEATRANQNINNEKKKLKNMIKLYIDNSNDNSNNNKNNLFLEHEQINRTYRTDGNINETITTQYEDKDYRELHSIFNEDEIHIDKDGNTKRTIGICATNEKLFSERSKGSDFQQSIYKKKNSYAIAKRNETKSKILNSTSNNNHRLEERCKINLKVPREYSKQSIQEKLNQNEAPIDSGQRSFLKLNSKRDFSDYYNTPMMVSENSDLLRPNKLNGLLNNNPNCEKLINIENMGEYSERMNKSITKFKRVQPDSSNSKDIKMVPSSLFEGNNLFETELKRNNIQNTLSNIDILSRNFYNSRDKSSNNEKINQQLFDKDKKQFLQKQMHENNYYSEGNRVSKKPPGVPSKTPDKNVGNTQILNKIHPCELITLYKINSNKASGIVKKCLHVKTLKLYTVKELIIFDPTVNQIIKDFLVSWYHSCVFDMYLVNINNLVYNFPEGSASIVCDNIPGPSIEEILNYSMCFSENVATELAFNILKSLKHFYYHMKKAHLGQSQRSLIYDFSTKKMKLGFGMGKKTGDDLINLENTTNSSNIFTKNRKEYQSIYIKSKKDVWIDLYDLGLIVLQTVFNDILSELDSILEINFSAQLLDLDKKKWLKEFGINPSKEESKLNRENNRCNSCLLHFIESRCEDLLRNNDSIDNKMVATMFLDKFNKQSNPFKQFICDMLSLEKGVHISMKKLFHKDVFKYYSENINPVPNEGVIRSNNKHSGTKQKVVCLNDLAKIAYHYDKNLKNKLIEEKKSEKRKNTESEIEPNLIDQIKNSIDLYVIDNEKSKPVINKEDFNDRIKTISEELGTEISTLEEFFGNRVEIK